MHEGSYILQCSAPIRAVPRDARRIFEQPVREPYFADRPARGEVVSFKRYHLGKDENEMRLGLDAKTAVQAEQIAALDEQRPELVIPAHQKGNLIKQRLLPPGRQLQNIDPPTVQRDPRGPLQERLAGNGVL